MTMDANYGIWFWFFLATMLYLGLFFLPGLLMKRAILRVIEIFCRYDAVGIGHAKSVEELGLAPRDFWQSLIRPRDYKPYALNSLRQAGIVLETANGEVYMVEDGLDERLRCNRLTPHRVHV
jgi:hypothetical protein